MPSFSFLHAADLHLDSPLLGLARKSADYAQRVDQASRRAFDNLIALAVAEECRFLLIAGDIFDGQWRDYTTGLFFVDRMRQLRDAGIEVFMILGNHDAENRFAARLELAENVHLLSHRTPQSISIDDLETVIHGRSFPQRDVTENIALGYPAPVPGRFNIGLLHTACAGRPGHAFYAPCTAEQLAHHGYDYWALGHVHAREVVSTEPYIVFPGNLQGRNPREVGPKGATLVRIENGRVAELSHQPLDVLRWAAEEVDISAPRDLPAVHSLLRERIEQTYAAAGGRGVALRLRLSGQTELHASLVGEQESLREEIETIAAHLADDLWIERVNIATAPPPRIAGVDPTIAGKMRHCVEDLSHTPGFTEFLDDILDELRTKFPASAHVEDLFGTIRSDEPQRALSLALALIERGGE